MFSFLLGNHQGVELLGHSVKFILILQEKAEGFSKVPVPFYILAGNNDISMPHTLANAWYCKFLKKLFLPHLDL